MFDAYYMDAHGHVYPNKLNDDDVRVAVISPEDREQVERLALLFVDHFGRANGGNRYNATQTALREFANPTPPKPEEPGTWGVVEAACVHSPVRRHWMKHEDGNWYVVGTDNKNTPDDWDSLVDPVLVREGVQA